MVQKHVRDVPESAWASADLDMGKKKKKQTENAILERGPGESPSVLGLQQQASQGR